MWPFLMLTLFPYRNERRCTRFPVVTTCLVGLNVLAYGLQILLISGGHDAFVNGLAFYPGKTPWYTMFSSMFLHGSVFHLAMNLWFFGLIGGQVEEEMRPLPFLLFYLGGGLCSSLGHAFYCWSVGIAGPQAVGVLGASGAIYAVLGAYFILFPFEEFRFWYFFFFRWGTIKIATLFFVLYKVCGDAVMAWAQLLGQQLSHVAHWAHLGGLVFGVAVAAIAFGGGAFIGKERPGQEERERRRRLKRVSRRKLYSDVPLVEPMTDAELAAATDDIDPAEGIRRGLFFHSGRLLEWAFQEMLIQNPKACLDPRTQGKLVEMLSVHGRKSLAQVAAWNLIEAHPNAPDAIQARLSLGRMLARLPGMKGEAIRLLKEFLAAGVAYRDQLEAEKLLRKLEERPLWQWK